MEPDSVTIIDRMGRQVIYTDYEEIYRKFGVEADFYIFQSILLNEAFSMFHEKGLSLHDYHLGIQSHQYQLSSAREKSRSLFSGSSGGFFIRCGLNLILLKLPGFPLMNWIKIWCWILFMDNFQNYQGDKTFLKKFLLQVIGD